MGCTASTAAQAGVSINIDASGIFRKQVLALGRLRSSAGGSGDDDSTQECRSEKGESDPQRRNGNDGNADDDDMYADILPCGGDNAGCRSPGRGGCATDDDVYRGRPSLVPCKSAASCACVGRDPHADYEILQDRNRSVRCVVAAPQCADVDEDDGPSETAFLNRRWLPLLPPETQFDMNELHDAEPPFFGGMYWTAVAPSAVKEGVEISGQRSRGGGDGVPQSSPFRRRGPQQLYKCQRLDMPSLITPSPGTSPYRGESSSASNRRGRPCAVRFPISDASIRDTSTVNTSTPKSHRSRAISLDSECSEWTETTGSSCNDDGDHAMNMNSDKKCADTSRELLNYSTAVDDSFISHHSYDPALEEGAALDERKISLQTPRQLFDKENDFAPSAPSPHRARPPCEPSASSNRAMTRATDACGYLRGAVEATDVDGSGGVIIRNGVLLRGEIVPPRGDAADVSTFAGAWGSRRERHVTTLPSAVPGKPIRLRITESSSNGLGSMGAGGQRSFGHDDDNGDMFSYDPYFSSGKYLISTSDGRPYGNGLVMKMGSSSPFMTLQDGRGEALAAAKSRYTWAPSHVIYAPKPRYAGQSPSSHRLSKISSAAAPRGVAGDGDGAASVVESVVEIDAGRHHRGDGREPPSPDRGDRLYPWALVKKNGRTMGDEACVHFVDEGSGRFAPRPTYRGRHGFDGEGLHTHTVVHRVISANERPRDGGTGDASGEGEKEVPCCIILRDPTDVDVFDVTIAPGIDPLLMICYLAAHSKMDIEHIFGGF